LSHSSASPDAPVGSNIIKNRGPIYFLNKSNIIKLSPFVFWLHTMICPKCHTSQPPSDECISCGIVFRKYKPKAHNSADSTSETLHTPSGPKAPHEKKGSFWVTFKRFRIAILLITLLFVALNAYWIDKRISMWVTTLHVVIYPINADNTSEVEDYIDSLERIDFSPIENFMRDEAELCDLNLDQPIAIHLAPEILEMPPSLTEVRDTMDAILWSLKMRYWAWQTDTYDGFKDVKIYVLYSTFKNEDTREISFGLQKGKIGLVQVPATDKLINHTLLVIAHEMLHTFGATDKYEYETLQPIYPDGFAEPDQQPRYPQRMAEIMAGTIPVSKTEITKPKNLDEVTLGRKTCVEIKWLDEESMD